MWKLKIPEKVIHFLWRGRTKSFPTKDNLRKRKIDLETLCLLCCQDQESALHIFNTCSYAQKIRKELTIEEVVGDASFFKTSSRRGKFAYLQISSWFGQYTCGICGITKILTSRESHQDLLKKLGYLLNCFFNHITAPDQLREICARVALEILSNDIWDAVLFFFWRASFLKLGFEGGENEVFFSGRSVAFEEG
ncbi:hypothetical protein LIER_30290 [Lithospermum erythrorhizon]|uniref:Reverse transcriptase zinc-binding domain-containing protein n=1 Tax=Lithospermum erythrorhizon TaxID=34254 RepID=A0AAV3RQ84_LITER